MWALSAAVFSMSARLAVEPSGADCVEGELGSSSLGTEGREMEEVFGSPDESMLSYGMRNSKYAREVRECIRSFHSSG